MNDNANDAAQKNMSLQELQQALVLQHRALFERLSTTESVEDASAISLEMDEVYLRIRVCGRLLFRQTSEAIDRQIEGVLAASDQLQASINSIARLVDLIKAISKFLGVVDKILDKVKLI